MRIPHLKVILFALFLSTPVASLILFDSVQILGRPRPDFPPIAELLRGKKGRMDDFGKAVLERSAPMKLAVQLQSWIAYRVVGFVDTPKIVSGEDGWLFYRPEFNRGRCLDEPGTAASLRRLAVLMDMGRAAGMDVIISISPDKSTIYPEMLSQRVRGYWKCRERSIATLRRLIKRWAPEIIDHAEPLLAEKARRPQPPLYYHADTHWSEYGAAIALRQLLVRIFPDAPVPPPRRSNATMVREADLSDMLLLPLQEQVAALDRDLEKKLRTLNRDPAGYRTVIAHDSFYGFLKTQLRAVFPTAARFQLAANDQELGHATESADRLIINVVERTLLARIERTELKWDTPMMRGIVKRNMAAAAACGDFTAIGAVPGGALDGDDPEIPIGPAASPARLPCLRLTLDAPKTGILEIMLPDSSGAFEPGHGFLYWISSDRHVVSFVLPDYVAGSSVRLHLGKGARIIVLHGVETGAVDRPPGLLAHEAQP